MEDKTRKRAAEGYILSCFNKRSRVQKNCPLTWPRAATCFSVTAVVAQIAGNAISELLDFKISRGAGP